MSERDILIERLERKLAEKERELMELRRMNREELEKIKREIMAEVKEEVLREVQKLLQNSQIQKLSEVDSKIVELRKAMESIINELAYVKGEIKGLLEKGESKADRREIVEEKIQKATVLENEPLYLPDSEEPREEKASKRRERDVIIPENKKEEKTDNGEDGLIICD